MTDSRIRPEANAFGPAAVDYERARPSYPNGAIECLRKHAGVVPDAVVCDLAAGTGKLTRLLAAVGARVIAVEPVPGMREQLQAAVPDAEVLDGVAENIPLDDQSVDTVTVAQAFHWFDFDVAMREIARVLKPGGTLAVLFNQRDDREPWVASMNEVIQWHSRNASRYQKIDWTDMLVDAGFTGVGHEAIEWSQPMNRDLLASRVRSVSYVAKEPPDVQRDWVERVLAVVADFPDDFEMAYVTHVWWARRN
jgi:SAM-dependent methyltransferase